jgi:hypothetical protein
MSQFPGKMTLAYVPQFPKNWEILEKRIRRSRFALEWHEEGNTPIVTSKHEPVHCEASESLPHEEKLEWDQVAEYSKIAVYFEQQLAKRPKPLTHHYVSVVARRT